MQCEVHVFKAAIAFELLVKRVEYHWNERRIKGQRNDDEYYDHLFFNDMLYSKR